MRKHNRTKNLDSGRLTWAYRNEEGKAQEAAGQLNDLGSGIKDRVSGTVGGAVAGMTGESSSTVDLMVC